jgi:hypothetical protein
MDACPVETTKSGGPADGPAEERLKLGEEEAKGLAGVVQGESGQEALLGPVQRALGPTGVRKGLKAAPSAHGLSPAVEGGMPDVEASLDLFDGGPTLESRNGCAALLDWDDSRHGGAFRPPT